MPDGLVINDTTYAGEVASQFLVKAITGADTISGGHVYVKDGIKKNTQFHVGIPTMKILFQDRQAVLLI